MQAGQVNQVTETAELTVGGTVSTQAPGPASRGIRYRRAQARLLSVLTALAIIYTLSTTQQILVPVALAFLLSMVLAPPVRWLRRLHIPRALGAGIVVLGLLSALVYGLNASVEPIGNWVEQAPGVLRQLEHKVYPIKKTVEEVNRTADQVDRIASMSANETVEIKGLSFQDMLYDNARGLLTGTILTTFLLFFFLSWGRVILIRIGAMLEEDGSRHRFLELSGLLEGEVSKYVSIAALINLGLGLVVAACLYAFEMPSPLLWGAVAGLLNFIPYVGGFITAGLLGATALLSFDGLGIPVLVVATFTGLTIIEGQIVTPLILGKQLALNPLVVFLSVIFWFWLWGVAGAFMAVPLLITLKLLGTRIEGLRPIAVIAGR